jgi:hypothetical protein
MKISSSDLQPSLEYSATRHHVPDASAAVFHVEELRVADVGVVNVNTEVALTKVTVVHLGSTMTVLNATRMMWEMSDALHPAFPTQPRRIALRGGQIEVALSRRRSRQSETRSHS